MLSKSVKIFYILSLLLVLHAGIGMAQTSTIRLTGTVTDETGGIILGADLTLKNVETGLTQSAISSASGTFSFANLPYGTYELRCELPGFKSFQQGGIVLETGFARTVNVVLQVGEVSETVSVIGRAPILETEASDVTQLVERMTMEKAPLASRRAGSLVRLSPFISYTREEGANALPYFSVAGGRARHQNWSMDGVTSQGNNLVVPQLAFNPPSEAVQEFKVEINNYSADQGRSLGGIIHMRSRSGTNEFHGAGYYFLRDDALDARTFFAPEKAPLDYDIFGFSVGGPLWKDRTFFFFNFEQGIKRTGKTFSSDDVPHSPERTGDFSNRTDVTILDPLTGQPFANNIIPQDRIDPVAAQVVGLYPLPNGSGNDITKAPKNNFIANDSEALDQSYPTLRLDHNLGDDDRFFFRWMRNEPTIINAAAWDFDTRARTVHLQWDNLAWGWNHTFSPTLLNDFRFMYRIAFNDVLTGAGVGSGLNQQFGLPGVEPTSLSRFKIAGLSQLGRGDFKRTDRNTNHFSENLTWIQGSHTFKTGMELRDSWYRQYLDESGFFDFSSRATGAGLATFLLGWTTKGQAKQQDIHSFNNYWAWYLMDDWKVTSRFTLNLGVRWSMDEPPWRDPVSSLNGFGPHAINPVSGTPGVVTFAPFPDTGERPHRFDGNNWAPRIGFAYRFRDTAVLRGGFGIMYHKPWAGSDAAKAADAGQKPTASFSSPDGGFTPAFLLQDGMPAFPEGEVKDASFGAVPLGAKPVFAPTFFDPYQRTPYSQQWNFGIQKQLPNDMVVEILYLGNMAHKLEKGKVNINAIPLVSGEGPENQSQALRPFPQFGNVSLLGPLWGNSSYHAANVKFERRFSDGLSFLMHYTWSKYLDDTTGGSDLGDAPNLQHIELRHLDKSLSPSHMAHRYLFHSVFDLPWGRGRHFEISNPVFNRIAGGWTISAITEFHTGVPFGVTEQTNTSNAFSDNQRPNVLSDPILSSNRTRGEELAEWFNTSAFQSPGVGRFGNAPRSFCCGPGLAGVDFSISKQFPIHEDTLFTFRADFFNLANRPHFAVPATSHGKGDFGTVSQLVPDSTGRQIQFNFRFEF